MSGHSRLHKTSWTAATSLWVCFAAVPAYAQVRAAPAPPVQAPPPPSQPSGDPVHIRRDLPPPPPMPSAAPLAFLFEHAKFQGVAQPLGPGAYDMAQLAMVGNDRISSVRLLPGVQVILFEHPNFQGRRIELRKSVKMLPPGFNDVTSSVIVQRVGQPIVPPPGAQAPQPLVVVPQQPVVVAPPQPMPPQPMPPQPMPPQPMPPQPVQPQIVQLQPAQPAPYVPQPTVRQDVEAGPIWSQQHAEQRCPQVCVAPARWTGQWRTVIPGQQSVCACELVAPSQPVLMPPAPPPGLRAPNAPPPAPPQPHAPHAAKRAIEAGPLWSQDHANQRCPQVCAPPSQWTGQWWTTVQGQMSV